MEKNKPLRIGVVLTLVFVLIFGLVFLIFNLAKKSGSNKDIEIVTTNFAAYDFARALTDGVDKSQVDIKMLLKPGSEAHSYEPTPQDIAEISKADLFIYNGGESEQWVEKLIEGSEIDKNSTVRMMDLVELKAEDDLVGENIRSADAGASDESIDAPDKGDEYDEHIWTSPKNDMVLVEKIGQKLAEKLPDYAKVFRANAESYKNEFSDIDKELQRIVKNAKRHELIFADRFPFKYLVDDYGIDYMAAFSGCSEQTEASSAQIAELISKVRNNQLSTILKIELTSDALAWTVAEATGAKIMTLYSAHNVSQEDFDSGRTLADMMRDNLVVLEEALN